jgi:hypothetical protein
MATVYSSRTCLPKLCCSILAIGLFTAGILITGAYPHRDLHDHYNQTNSSTDTTNRTSTGNATLAAERLAFIQASNEALYAQLDALARIHRNVQQNQELAQRIARSPRVIKTIQALEATITRFTQNNPEPEYEMSEYATGNRRWKEESPKCASSCNHGPTRIRSQKQAQPK